MKGLKAALVGIGALLLVTAASPAFGATTTSVKLTFAEPIQPGLVSGCPITPQEGLCGSGQVIPFGHATETVQFGAACGGNCDLRTIALSTGTLTTNEFFSDFTCPSGNCERAGFGQPASGTIQDVVVGGTGIFANASGTLTGSVHAAGTAGITHLSGQLTLG